MTDAERLDWLENHFFRRRWMPPVESPFTWELAGPYRHLLAAMKGGKTLREAIDIAGLTALLRNA